MRQLAIEAAVAMTTVVGAGGSSIYESSEEIHEL